MKISIPIFKGIRPVVADQLLPTTEATEAYNSKMISGELRSFFNKLKNAQLVSPITLVRMYYYLSTHWFEFQTDVDVVPGPLANDSTNKVYFTGDGIPKKTNEDQATVGAGTMPYNYYPMAAPQPCTHDDGKPGVSCVPAGTLRTVSYIFTARSKMEDDTLIEESPPSLPSDYIDQEDESLITVANLDLRWTALREYNKGDFCTSLAVGAGNVGEDGDYMYICTTPGIVGGAEPAWDETVGAQTVSGTATFECYENTLTEKVLYRVARGNQLATYDEVAEIALGTYSYDDTVADADLGDTCDTIDWVAPPQNMIGLVAGTGGMLFGFYGKDFYRSRPYYPHLWYNGSLSQNAEIVALGVDGSSVVCSTENQPVVITGNTPDSLTPDKRPESKPCLSKLGLVDVPGGVLYPTTDGLYFISANGEGRIVTEEYFSKSEWEDIYPDSFIAGYNDGNYVAFYTDGDDLYKGIVINFKRGIVTKLDYYSPVLYIDKAVDALYYIEYPATAEIRLTEDGTSYPSRTGGRLLEDGNYRLLE